MNPVRIPDEEIPEGYTRTLWAKNQFQYEPLPALNGPEGSDVVLTRWEPSEEERMALINGAKIELRLWTFGKSLQPSRVDVQGVVSNEPPPREQVIGENRD